jgi:hypothetical protein
MSCLIFQLDIHALETSKKKYQKQLPFGVLRAGHVKKQPTSKATS